MGSTSDISIGSFNCRGLASDPVKRRSIFNHMRDKYDISILLETHSIREVEYFWLAEWGYKGWFSSYKSDSRGVAILIKIHLNLNIIINGMTQKEDIVF